MAEYINREKAKHLLHIEYAYAAEQHRDAKKLIETAKTVDAVPVVRCKDCKHYRNYPNGLCYLHTEPKTNSRGYSGDAVCVEPEDFCSYGERKEGAEICTCPNELECPAIGSDVVCFPWCEYLEDGDGDD